MGPAHEPYVKLQNGFGMIDLQKHIWEGWTVGDFVERLAPVVPGESALLQKAHSGSCRLFCPEVSFTLKQQEMIYYHRFYVESLYPENRRRILRWLFRTFSVYLCEATPAGYKGRFYTQNVRFPKAAFRDLTFSLRGDRSLCLWVISYDLHTLYLERNIYVYGKWLDR